MEQAKVLQRIMDTGVEGKARLTAVRVTLPMS
jgi:hypothetical protein